MTVIAAIGFLFLVFLILADGQPSQQGTPRYTGESRGEYVARSTRSGCAFFLPPLAVLGILAWLVFVILPAMEF